MPELNPPHPDRAVGGLDKTMDLDLDLVTVADMAAWCRVSKMTIYRLIHAGQLPALRIGRSLRIPRAAARAVAFGQPAGQPTGGWTR